MKSPLLITLTVICGYLFIGLADAGQFGGVGYRFSVPDDWQAASKSRPSRQLFTPLGLTSPNRFPYFVVISQSTGRMPSTELSRIARFDPAVPFFAGLKSGGMRFAVEGNILWKIVRRSDVIGLSGVVLTEEGSIQVLGYAREENFAKYLPIFRQVVESVELDKDLQYRNFMGSYGLIKLLLPVLMIAMLFFLMRRSRRCIDQLRK